MAPLSLLLLLVSLTAFVPTNGVSATDGDRISHLEDVIKTMLEVQEKEKHENTLQNKRIWNLEKTITRYEEENKKLKTENEDLKSNLNKMEISVKKMDALVKRLQKENLILVKKIKSNSKLINYIQFRILHFNNEGLENSMQPERTVSVKVENSEDSPKLNESEVESKSLVSSRKRLLTGIPTTPQPNGVAFSVYLKPHETHLIRQSCLMAS
ncbi:uncharacterized protein LOC134275026 [Saccostrea cucullata]|uniref:uncharacterized protein LOC134275026 n=1 Tax=Saccostrea cuccullata TaxID=36930 RepID=UPI002ED19C11